MTKGTYSIGCLRDSNGTTIIENVLEANHEGIIVSGISAIDSSQNAQTNINYQGIQFSTNLACLYFGSNQEFRLRFGQGEAPGGGNILAIESYDGHGGYTSRISFSDET
jgi:hypothetical protein